MITVSKYITKTESVKLYEQHRKNNYILLKTRTGAYRLCIANVVDSFINTDDNYNLLPVFTGVSILTHNKAFTEKGSIYPSGKVFMHSEPNAKQDYIAYSIFNNSIEYVRNLCQGDYAQNFSRFFYNKNTDSIDDMIKFARTANVTDWYGMAYMKIVSQPKLNKYYKKEKETKGDSNDNNN